ncbi:alpha/beta fold hydrolase [Oryzibacter oryziterrae]|uniref:alpha/beta fold hydrolase n=1 Tax=Oryzibacter oryziterrae TaxID=2766474 RepID=UPI001F3A3CA5|nr:alpha/beta hydrolase [Oryzibacter oryziterrae]
MGLSTIMLVPILEVVAGLGLLLLAIQHLGSSYLNRRFPPVGAFVDVGGRRLHVLEEGGEGLPIVFVHGASSNLLEAHHRFSGRFGRRRVIYFDRPGHGHSDRGDEPMSAPSAQAGVLAGLLDRLEVPQAILVGHSWGGAVIAAFALAYPERTAGLLFVAPATHPWPGGVDLYYRLSGHRIWGRLFVSLFAMPLGWLVFRSGVRSVFAPDALPVDYLDKSAARLLLRANNFLANARDVLHLNENLRRQSPGYARIDAPTIVLTGDRDSVVWPSIHSEGLRASIAGAELITLPGCGHMPHQVYPEMIVELVARIDRAAGAMRDASASLDAAK